MCVEEKAVLGIVGRRFRFTAQIASGSSIVDVGGGVRVSQLVPGAVTEKRDQQAMLGDQVGLRLIQFEACIGVADRIRRRKDQADKAHRWDERSGELCRRARLGRVSKLEMARSLEKGCAGPLHLDCLGVAWAC
jgi:hypothetical protein